MHRKLPYKAILLALLGSSCLFTLTGFFGEANWLFDLTSHFRVQYMALQLMGLTLLLWHRPQHTFLGSIMLLGCFVLNFSQILPYYQSVENANNSAHSLKILHINVFKANPIHDVVIQTIREKKPDILSLQEIDEEWRKVLEKSGVLDEYNHKALHPFSENGLYIRRHPVEDIRVELVPDVRSGVFVERGEGSILIARLRIADEPVTLINLHPATPITPKQHHLQQRHFETLLKARDTFGPNIVLIGDLNNTPWSSSFKKLQSGLKLHDSRLGKGLLPTWPSYFPALFIPIDHVLVSEKFITLTQETGPFTGSDHLPLYVELGMKE